MRLGTPRGDSNFPGIIGTYLYKDSLKQIEGKGGREEGKTERRKKEGRVK